mgnify:FL=1
MNLARSIITIIVLMAATMVTRFLPFLIFKPGDDMPKFIKYLGNALPPAVFGMLVVYCLKSVNFFATPYGIPELGAVALTAAVHIYKRNTLLSIALGTACYMLLIRKI